MSTDLMSPRFLVIADYPGNTFKVGDILDRDWGWGGDDEIGFKQRVSDFPHIFKPLAWWERREVDQLPQYVTINGARGVYKVKSWKHNGSEMNAIIEGTALQPPIDNLTPATLSEYNEYKNKGK